MKKTSFVSALKDPKPLIGTAVTVPSAEVAEALSMIGFDWLFVDLEHSAIDIPGAQSILQAVSHRAYVALRLSANDPVQIRRALDTGCDAVIVPFVNSATEARAAVNAAKYPPVGERTIGVGRAHSYGLAFASYIDTANRSIGLVLQVEHEKALSEVDEILKVEGIDAIFVGPYDLSASMGLVGQPNHAKVVAAIDQVRAQCMEKEMPFGIFCEDGVQAAAEAARGAKLVVFATDLMFMTTGAAAGLGQSRESATPDERN